MKQQFAKIALIASLLLNFSLVFAAAPLAHAVDCSTQAGLTAQEAIQCGANGASGNTQDTDQSSATATNTLNNTTKNVLDVFTVVVGIASVIMIMIGGFRYVVSSGKQESVTSAKNSIVFALVGLIIVAFAQVIVHFVLNKATATVKNSGGSAGSAGGGSRPSQVH